MTLVKNCVRMGLSVPTRVQDMTLPMLLQGISTFILAQTGTGKTLAYVLPIVHKLLSNNEEGFFPKSQRPRAIIVQPTRELALQTIKVGEGRGDLKKIEMGQEWRSSRSS